MKESVYVSTKRGGVGVGIVSVCPNDRYHQAYQSLAHPSPRCTCAGVAEITVGDSSGTPQLKFEQQEYVKEIPENSPADTTVTTVGVSYSGSGAVTYSFANGNAHNTFKINSQTGAGGLGIFS